MIVGRNDRMVRVTSEQMLQMARPGSVLNARQKEIVSVIDAAYNVPVDFVQGITNHPSKMVSCAIMVQLFGYELGEVAFLMHTSPFSIREAIHALFSDKGELVNSSASLAVQSVRDALLVN